ncbi:phage major capsid protein [Dongia deserti]|uniref:phage major capsid protein n=1 Tax=Dongia deserti TaxID=2268030 RepID=UPI002547AE30|nr:hypothetical protein [Dongia deserti]
MSRVLVIGGELPARFIEAAGAALPETGIIGEAAIREAVATDYRQLGEMLHDALRKVFKAAGDIDCWPNVLALYADHVVVRRETKIWSYPYSHDAAANTLTLGAPVEVVASYEPVAMREALTDGVFIEAAAKPGRYKIRVIKGGLSGNGNYYPDAVLREAAPLFDGARVFVKSDKQHLAGEGKDFRNLIGGLSKPIFIEGKAPDSGEIQAVFTLIDANGPEALKIREAWDSGLTNLFGFSIDAKGLARSETAAGRPRRTATKFIEVNSVDLIVEPGAGGRVIGLLEAKKDVIMDRTKMLALLEAKRPDLLQGKKVDQLTDEQLEALFTEALGQAASASQPANVGGTPVTQEQLAETIRMTEARAYARAAIAASGLPDEAKTKLTAQVTLMAKFTEAEIDKLIGEERTYIAKFTESGKVQLGGFPRIEVGETRAQKVAAMLDAFFDPEHKDHRHARSFRECYVVITGDHNITGRLDNCDQVLLRESLDSGSFANVLGNSITRRMIADYRLADQYGIWRQIVNVVPVRDFRSQERTRYGGYGDLPIVAEAAPYLAQSSPSDEKATYAIAKRGGTEDVTLEMITNDDVGAIRSIPIKLSRASKRTLSKFVFDFIRTNPTAYDGIALFHASHGNLGSAALDTTSLAARRLAMMKQTELSSADRLGIPPKGMMVPVDLQEAAVNLFKLSTNNEKTFIQAMTLDILPVWYWTDTNDWALYADPMDVPGIEIGFLNGNEEPELFVQDAPTVGSMFTNDKTTYKIRHIYGGAPVDFRAFDKSVVA